MKIALIQLDSVWESKQVNLQRAELFINRAAQEMCDLVVFPEMFSSGFSMNVTTIAEEGLGETVSFLSRLAKTCSINLIAGFPIKTPMEEKGRNMAFFFNREGRLDATYTKIHLFSYAGEDRHYVAGEHTSIFRIDKIPSSVFICYDLRFPEVFRSVAQDVRIIFVIANWPTERKEHWDALLKARAVENQCFVVGVNRTGLDGNGLSYPGASCVLDPLGRLVCAGNETDEFLTCEVDPEDVERVRVQFPFLKDMHWTKPSLT